MGRKERRAKERQERKESIRMTPDRIYELKTENGQRSRPESAGDRERQGKSSERRLLWTCFSCSA